MATFTTRLPGGGGQYTLELTVYESNYNKANNTSDMYWLLQIRKHSGTGYSSGYKHDYQVKVDGVVVASGELNGYDFRNYTVLTLASGTRRGVPHNADGGGGCFSTAYFNSTQKGTLGYGEVEGWSSMTKFNRVAVVTSIPSTVVIGDDTSVTWYDQNTGAYHDISLWYNHFDYRFWYSTNYRSGGTSYLTGISHSQIMELIRLAASNDIYLRYQVDTFAYANSSTKLGTSSKTNTGYFKKPVISGPSSISIGSNIPVSVSGSYGPLTGSAKYITKAYVGSTEVYSISHQGTSVVIPASNDAIKSALLKASGNGNSATITYKTMLSNGNNADLGTSNTVSTTVNTSNINTTIALIKADVDTVTYSISTSGNIYPIRSRQVSLDGGSYVDCVSSGGNYIITVPVDGKQHSIRVRVAQNNSDKWHMSNTLSFNTARHLVVTAPSKKDYVIGEASLFPYVANEATGSIQIYNHLNRLVRTHQIPANSKGTYNFTPTRADFDLGQMLSDNARNMSFVDPSSLKDVGFGLWNLSPTNYTRLNKVKSVENVSSSAVVLGDMIRTSDTEPPKNITVEFKVYGKLGSDHSSFIVFDGNTELVHLDSTPFDCGSDIYCYTGQYKFSDYVPETLQLRQSSGTTTTRVVSGFYEDASKSTSPYKVTEVPYAMLYKGYRDNMVLESDIPGRYDIPRGSYYAEVSLDSVNYSLKDTPETVSLLFKASSVDLPDLNEVTVETSSSTFNLIRKSNGYFHDVIKISKGDFIRIYGGPKDMHLGIPFEISEVLISKGASNYYDIVYSANRYSYDKRYTGTAHLLTVKPNQSNPKQMITLSLGPTTNGTYQRDISFKRMSPGSPSGMVLSGNPEDTPIPQNVRFAVSDTLVHDIPYPLTAFTFLIKEAGSTDHEIVFADASLISYPEVDTKYPFKVYQNSKIGSGTSVRSDVATVTYQFQENISFFDGSKFVLCKPNAYVALPTTNPRSTITKNKSHVMRYNHLKCENGFYSDDMGTSGFLIDDVYKNKAPAGIPPCVVSQPFYTKTQSLLKTNIVDSNKSSVGTNFSKFWALELDPRTRRVRRVRTMNAPTNVLDSGFYVLVFQYSPNPQSYDDVYVAFTTPNYQPYIRATSYFKNSAPTKDVLELIDGQTVSFCPGSTMPYLLPTETSSEPLFAVSLVKASSLSSPSVVVSTKVANALSSPDRSSTSDRTGQFYPLIHDGGFLAVDPSLIEKFYWNGIQYSNKLFMYFKVLFFDSEDPSKILSTKIPVAKPEDVSISWTPVNSNSELLMQVVLYNPNGMYYTELDSLERMGFGSYSILIDKISVDSATWVPTDPYIYTSKGSWEKIGF